jgi:hypothetical protein
VTTLRHHLLVGNDTHATFSVLPSRVRLKVAAM